MSAKLSYEVMPLEVYEGAGGHIVLRQEWPSLKGDTFLRVFVHPCEAEALCEQIMAVARGMRR